MFRLKKGVKKQKTPKKSAWKKLAIFLGFIFIFSAVTMPFLVFYGPFENVKVTVVGTFWNTLKHQWVAKMFLSDEAIDRILGAGYEIDPEAAGDAVDSVKIKAGHTDKIDIYNIDGGDFDGKLMIIYDPSRIEAGYSEQMPKSGETTSTIAKRNKAVAAINAGGFMDAGWAGTGGAPMGYIIHNGKVIYDEKKADENTKQDTVAFTSKGVLIVGSHSIAQLKKLGVKEGVSFGPPLIVNGKPTIKKGIGNWGIAPRTAIGQRADGAVLFLVVDGRRAGSLGASLRDVQDILLKYNAVNACNLDGGSSATMYHKGKIINTPSDALGERAVPSAFVVMPLKGGT